MNVFDTIYLYDPNDRQYEAQVREITTRAIGVKYNRTLDREGRVESQMFVSIMRPKYNGDRRIEIRNDEVTLPDWQWSYQRVSPIRKGATVVIKNWDRLLECRVHGLVEGGAGRLSFAYEGIKALPRDDRNGGGADLGRIKGHHFTASVEAVQKIVKNGRTGRRLLLGPFMTKVEERVFFKELYYS